MNLDLHQGQLPRLELGFNYRINQQMECQMTQHGLAEQTQEDHDTMRSLGLFVGYFAAFAIVLALGVTFFAP